MMQATQFLSDIALELSEYITVIAPLEKEKANHKAKIKELETEIAKHTNLKYRLVTRALRFWRFAQRKKENLLTGVSKTVKTGSGSFSWKFNSMPSLIYDNEAAVIAELKKSGQANLIVESVDKEAVKAAVASGALRNCKSFRVEQIERLVISPNSLPPVTVYPDGRVEFDCEG